MHIKLLAATLIALMPAVAVADFYKCTGPDGKITYSDKRCVATTSVVHSTVAGRGTGFIVPRSGQVADDPAGAQQLQNLSHATRAKPSTSPADLR